jgi:hypothetical protein
VKTFLFGGSYEEKKLFKTALMKMLSNYADFPESCWCFPAKLFLGFRGSRKSLV